MTMKRSLIAAVCAGLVVSAFLSGQAYADRQGKMHDALDNLRSAESLLENASRDKGGHRVKALRLVRSAIGEVKAGINYDNRH
jgi:hypothetical protein